LENGSRAHFLWSQPVSYQTVPLVSPSNKLVAQENTMTVAETIHAPPGSESSVRLEVLRSGRFGRLTERGNPTIRVLVG
jgi:hypothetical protein